MDNRIYMRDALNKSGVYETERPNVNAELSSYEYGINKFYEECERVIGNCFISTADEENLYKRASLFRNYVVCNDTEVLRGQLSEKAKVRKSGITDMLNRLQAVGISGEITEGVNEVTVKVTSYEGNEAERARNELKKYMPVYVNLIFI